MHDRSQPCSTSDCTLRRTIRHWNKQVWLALYTTLVRPHVEYAANIWSPHYECDKKVIEKVQHKATQTNTSHQQTII